jgi:hypothetical protein
MRAHRLESNDKLKHGHKFHPGRGERFRNMAEGNDASAILKQIECETRNQLVQESLPESVPDRPAGSRI